jgi:phospholipid transport system substrate-binding protein
MRKLMFALTLLTGLSLAAAAPAAASCDDALQFVSTVGTQVTDTVANTSMSAEQRLTKFRSIFRNNADIQTMGRFALGKHWDKLPANRQSEYFNLLEETIGRVIFGQLNDYAGERYTIDTDRCSPKGSKGIEYIVDGAVIKDGGGKVTDVRWWLINPSGHMRVFDVSIAGIWLAQQKRDEFDRYIMTHGMRPETLLDSLKHKLGS